MANGAKTHWCVLISLQENENKAGAGAQGPQAYQLFCPGPQQHQQPELCHGHLQPGGRPCGDLTTSPQRCPESFLQNQVPESRSTLLWQLRASSFGQVDRGICCACLDASGHPDSHFAVPLSLHPNYIHMPAKNLEDHLQSLDEAELCWGAINVYLTLPLVPLQKKKNCS